MYTPDNPPQQDIQRVKIEASPEIQQLFSHFRFLWRSHVFIWVAGIAALIALYIFEIGTPQGRTLILTGPAVFSVFYTVKRKQIVSRIETFIKEKLQKHECTEVSADL